MIRTWKFLYPLVGFISTFGLSTSAFDSTAQSISNYLYGQNAWMPSLVSGGELEDVLDKLEIEDTEPFGIIRIGGTRFDDNPLTNAQYETLIAGIRSIGAEPLVQVPISQDDQYAANLVTYINITKGLNVKFWSIGNEPDLGWLDEEVDGRVINSADDVAFYFKSRASAMKSVDSSIKIFGPDYSFFVDDEDNAGWHPMDTWHYPLLDNNDHGLWGKDTNGNYYVDYYAFHVYQYVTPDNVERKLNTVLSHINTINNLYRDSDNKLGWAITETHITTNNNNVSDHDKTWSFYAGQHISQIIGLGMKYKAFCVNPWSIHESGGLRDGAGSYEGGAYDLGFFDQGPTYKPRSTYYHEFMLSKKAKKNYVWGYTNNSKIMQVATKDETGYAIMVMNDNSTGGTFTLRLNYEDQTDTYEIYVDANLAKQYQGSIDAYETQMLFFNTVGDHIGTITYDSQDAADGNPPTYTGSTPDRVALAIWKSGSWTDTFTPNEGTDAKLSADYSMSGNGSFEANHLTVDASMTFTIESGLTLVVHGDLTNNGSIVVESGGSLITKGTISGTGFTIKRATTFNTATGRYSAIGSPVSGASTGVLGSLVYAYDESVAYGTGGTERFNQVTSPETMQAGNAYFSANTGTVTFTGAPNTGDVSVTLVYNSGTDGSNAGFNLVSNPYPAAISYDKFVEENVTTNSVITGTIYLWDDGGSNTGQRTNGDYITANSMGAASAGSGRSGDWNGYIGSAQGFFIKATTAGTLKFTNAMKAKGNNSDGAYFRTTGDKNSSSFPTVKLTLKNHKTNASKETLIGLAEEATSGVDLLYDADMIGGTNGVKLYSLIDDKPFTIQGVPLDQTSIPLGFDVRGEAGEFSIFVNSLNNWPEGQDIYLEDHYIQKYFKLQSKDAHQFTSQAGQFNDRFTLHIALTDNLLEAKVNSTIDVRYFHAGVMVKEVSDNFQIKILDISGRLYLDMEVVAYTNNELIIPFRFENKKTYIVQIISGKETITDKISME